MTRNVIGLSVFAALILVTAGAVLFLVANAPSADRQILPDPILFIDTMEAQPEAFQAIVESSGEVTARRQIAVVSEVGGRLVEVHRSFEEGGFFSAGEVLARLDQSDLRPAVTEARSAVAAARDGLAREEAEAELARRAFEVLGRDRPDLNPLATREPQLESARATLQSAVAQLERAELNVSRALIRAPFNGQFLSISADQGQVVTAGEPIAQIFSTDTVRIRLPLTLSDAALLSVPLTFAKDSQPGPAVRLTTQDSARSDSWTGELVRVISRVDRQTRNVFVVVEVNDPYGLRSGHTPPLVMGTFVSAEIEGRVFENAVRVPLTALQTADTVFVVDSQNTLVERSVIHVPAGPGFIAITDGVAAGDRIVTERVSSDRLGQEVSVRRVTGSEVSMASREGTQ